MEKAGNDAHEPSRPIELVLELSSARELYQGLAPTLATDGIFIEIADPAPPGAVVELRVVLPDGVVVLQGDGTVLWRRAAGDDDGPAGMAVRFDTLSRSTRETIDAVIDAHLAGGGELFDLDGGSDRGVFPTDALVGRTAAFGPGRWQRRPAPASNGRETNSEARTRLFRSAAEADAIDLRFEEVLHGLAEAPGTDDAAKRRMDEAIAAAVVPSSVPDDDRMPAEAETGDEPGGETGADAIPAILDGWKHEIDEGLGHLARAGGVRGSSEERPAPAAVPLPFTADAPDLETRPIAPGELESGRRRAAPSPARWPWWLLGAAALVLLAVVLVWLWPGARPAAVDSAAELPEPPLPTAVSPVAAVTEPSEEPGHPVASAADDTRPAEGAAAGSAIRSIEWRSLPGATEVVLRANGSLDEGRVDTLRLDGPPRVLVRLRGIEIPYTPHHLEVETPEVSTIRIGHHPEFHPPELYVVLDAAKPGVAVISHRVDGDTLRVVVGLAG